MNEFEICASGERRKIKAKTMIGAILKFQKKYGDAIIIEIKNKTEIEKVNRQY